MTEAGDTAHTHTHARTHRESVKVKNCTAAPRLKTQLKSTSFAVHP